MRKALFTILFLAATSAAQDRPRLLDKTDAALIAASAADVWASRGLREANPLARGDDGRLSLSKGIALKAGLFAGFKVAEFAFPTERRSIRNAKRIAAIAFTAMAIRGFCIKRPR